MFIQTPPSGAISDAAIAQEMTSRRALLAMLASAAPMAVLPGKPRTLPGTWAFFKIAGADPFAPETVEMWKPHRVISGPIGKGAVDNYWTYLAGKGGNVMDGPA